MYSYRDHTSHALLYTNSIRPPGEPLMTHVMQGNISDVWRTFFNDDPANDVWHMYMMRDPGLQMYIKGVWNQISQR